jgi:cell division septation protein DedD
MAMNILLPGISVPDLKAGRRRQKAYQLTCNPMPNPSANVTTTTEVGYCPFCQRTRNLRRDEHKMGGLVRTTIDCESCHRTLSSTIGPPQAKPEPEPVKAAEPEPEAEAKPARKAAAAKKPAAVKKAAASSKPAAAKKAAPARKTSTTKKK